MILLLIVGPTTYAAAACAGWSSSAAERMACCLAVAGHCAAISSDDCCADGEERENVESATAVAVAPPEGVSATPNVRPPLRRPSAAVHQTAPGRPDTYLLDSVFLI
jgi:hypothetical protein